MIKNPKGSRFQAWAALFIFSCVCLTAHLSPSPTTNCSVDWVTAALSISLIFSFFGTLAHFFISDKFVGQMLEGGLAFFLLIIWCACLPTIMNPNNNISKNINNNNHNRKSIKFVISFSGKKKVFARSNDGCFFFSLSALMSLRPLTVGSN